MGWEAPVSRESPAAPYCTYVDVAGRISTCTYIRTVQGSTVKNVTSASLSLTSMNGNPGGGGWRWIRGAAVVREVAVRFHFITASQGSSLSLCSASLILMHAKGQRRGVSVRTSRSSRPV